MCCLLANPFNSVFTKPKQTYVIKDPVTLFLSPAITTSEDDLFLIDIPLSDSIITEDIKEISPNSGGPGDIPISRMFNCAEELALFGKLLFTLPLF